MTDAEKIEFAIALGETAEIMGVPGLDERQLAAWANLFNPHPISDLRRGLTQMLRNEQIYGRFPAPSALNKYLPQTVSADDRSSIEADRLLLLMAKEGAAAKHISDDPVTMAVLDARFGGWKRLCETHLSSHDPWFKKSFCESYGAYSRAEVMPVYEPRKGLSMACVSVDGAFDALANSIQSGAGRNETACKS